MKNILKKKLFTSSIGLICAVCICVLVYSVGYGWFMTNPSVDTNGLKVNIIDNTIKLKQITVYKKSDVAADDNCGNPHYDGKEWNLVFKYAKENSLNEDSTSTEFKWYNNEKEEIKDEGIFEGILAKDEFNFKVELEQDTGWTEGIKINACFVGITIYQDGDKWTGWTSKDSISSGQEKYSIQDLFAIHYYGDKVTNNDGSFSYDSDGYKTTLADYPYTVCNSLSWTGTEDEMSFEFFVQFNKSDDIKIPLSKFKGQSISIDYLQISTD